MGPLKKFELPFPALELEGSIGELASPPGTAAFTGFTSLRDVFGEISNLKGSFFSSLLLLAALLLLFDNELKSGLLLFWLSAFSSLSDKLSCFFGGSNLGGSGGLGFSESDFPSPDPP